MFFLFLAVQSFSNVEQNENWVYAAPFNSQDIQKYAHALGSQNMHCLLNSIMKPMDIVHVYEQEDVRMGLLAGILWFFLHLYNMPKEL